MDTVRQVIEKAASIDPNNIDLAILEGTWYLQRQEYLKAATVLHWVTTKRENDFLAWYYLGIAFHHLGSFEEAEFAFQRAASLDTSRSNAHMS